MTVAAFDWYPRWRAAHKRIWNPPNAVFDPLALPRRTMRWSTPMVEPLYENAPADDRELINRILDELPPLTKIKQIVAATARHTGIPADELVGRCRTGPVVHARQIAMTLAREMLHLSFPEIGRRFGRDHTTVLFAYNKYYELVRLCLLQHEPIEQDETEVRELGHA